MLWLRMPGKAKCGNPHDVIQPHQETAQRCRPADSRASLAPGMVAARAGGKVSTGRLGCFPRHHCPHRAACPLGRRLRADASGAGARRARDRPAAPPGAMGRNPARTGGVIVPKPPRKQLLPTKRHENQVFFRVFGLFRWATFSLLSRIQRSGTTRHKGQSIERLSRGIVAVRIRL